MTHQGRGALWILLGVAAVLALGGIAAGQPAAAPGTEKPGAAKKPGARQQDNWPKKIPFGEFTAVLDAPQAESLEGTKLKARGTFRMQRGDEGEGQGALGTAWYEADVEIDRDRRTVTMVSVEVPKVELAGAPAARQQRIAQRLATVFSHQQPKLSLDEVLASTKMARSREETPPKLNTEPPKILFVTEPAILVIFDGEPRFRAVEGSKLERALNTPFLVLRVPGNGECYLNGGTTWFRADDPKGPWTTADHVPNAAIQIAQRDLKDGGVSDSEIKEASQSAEKRVPKIIVATEPTELVVSDGPPQWNPIVAGELDAMTSSDNDVFRTTSDQQIFLILSGRWYKSGSLEGPWTFVQPDRLPASFRKIPSDSDKADALASVPGTAAAQEALADASKPRTAAIRRSEAHVEVTYDGEPKFEAVAGTRVEYALNTPDQVLKIRGRYYVCDQGVWFSAGSPTGPWAVADSIPEEEIQTIPPESPVYNTRYAYVYDSTPEVVYTAYTPGYLGSYSYYGGVVFGTGWAYRPWWGAAYYPRAWTWGFHARYAPWIGWGYGFGWGRGWGGFRYGFGFGWGARWCGPGGFFRPAYRNVNITRNVNINRNVNVNRNVYNSGANRSRAATTTRTAARNATASRQGANRTARSAQSAHGNPSAHANKARPGAQGAQRGRAAPHAGGAKGHAGGHGGGKIH
jgi:hypothetical protein